MYRFGDGGESVAALAARAVGLLRRLEAASSGRAVILVSHGDTLQILRVVARAIVGGGGEALRKLWREDAAGARGEGLTAEEMVRLDLP